MIEVAAAVAAVVISRMQGGGVEQSAMQTMLNFNPKKNISNKILLIYLQLNFACR